MYARPPVLSEATAMQPLKRVLPDPARTIERLRDTPFAAEVIAIAEQALRRELPVFGSVIRTGPEIHWRKDYASGIETGTEFFRRIPYLDAARVGDHKQIWEINRHQHLVAMSQAALFTGRPDFLSDI